MQLATDWDQYYDRPLATAKLTRRYTTRWLRRSMQKYVADRSELSIIEFGGGNSCFFRALVDSLPITRYDVVDLNEKSLRLFDQQARERTSVRTAAYQVDLLTNTPTLPPADVVFSVGLIEHFDEEGTRRVARRHFSCVKEGGLVIITAPTPTWLYRSTRFAAEQLDIWQFPDERPLRLDEMESIGERLGKLQETTILWPLFLTQRTAIWRASQNEY